MAVGAELFLSNCSLCHGKTGDQLPGKNLRQTQIDEAGLTKVISRGRPGTAMPPFGAEDGGALKKFEIADVITFIQNWDQSLIESAAAHLPVVAPPSPPPAPPTPAATPKATAPPKPPTAPTVTKPPQKPTPTPRPTTPTPGAGPDVQRGQTVYNTLGGCAACHGAEAQGGLGPPLKGLDAPRITAAVRNGKGIMPRFTAAQISDADLANIIDFLATIK